MNIVRFILCLGLLLAGSGVSYAGFTILGPTPYRSAADSPFNLSGLGTTFFLEDFEDDVLTPGLQGGYPSSLRPITGNSVDGDDGILDGLDSGGRSVEATPFGLCAGPDCIVQTQWDFYLPTPFDRWPTAVGLVITANSGAEGKLVVEGFGQADSEFERLIIDFEGLTSEPGNSSDDLFIGFINPLGIISVYIEQSVFPPPPATTYSFPHFDHLQYGLLIPEPSSLCMIILTGGLFMHRYCYRRNSA